MSVFPYFEGDLLIGIGHNSPVGLCTGWTPKTAYSHMLLDVCAIGSLYSHQGIGRLIRNLLAVPSCEHVVIVGADLTGTLDTLASRKIDATKAGIEAEYIQQFYEYYKIHDWRNMNKEELVNEVRKLKLSKHRPEPLLLPLPEIQPPSVFPAARSGHIIRADSIRDGHRKLIEKLWRFGYDLPPDKEGHTRRQLWQLLVVLGDATKIEHVPNTTLEAVQVYCEKIWTGQEPETDSQGNKVTYRYGHTMRARYGDQIAQAIEIFKRSPVSFRPVISLWEPYQSMVRDDEPCLILVHPFINGDKLEMFAYIRTNEMFYAWPTNAAGLRYVQERMAEELCIAVGELSIMSGSAHIYDHTFAAVEEYVNRPRPHRIEFDPQGDWRLWRDSEGYHAEHYSGGVLLQSFCDYNLEVLARKIEPFISVPSHGIHIGREIERLAK